MQHKINVCVYLTNSKHILFSSNKSLVDIMDWWHAVERVGLAKQLSLKTTRSNIPSLYVSAWRKSTYRSYLVSGGARLSSSRSQTLSGVRVCLREAQYVATPTTPQASRLLSLPSTAFSFPLNVLVIVALRCRRTKSKQISLGGKSYLHGSFNSHTPNSRHPSAPPQQRSRFQTRVWQPYGHVPGKLGTGLTTMFDTQTTSG